MKKFAVSGLIIITLTLAFFSVVFGIKYYKSEKALEDLFAYSNVIDLTGEGKVFCVNGDYEEFVDYMADKGMSELSDRRMGLMVFFEKDGKETGYVLNPNKKYTMIYREDAENIPS